ncbi:hypothetical protein RUM44_011875 [Polyplax serrata]|uniref:Phosphomevalonate kinase n=1 Tax=Polyplax serrata TaxID=468196 RepID=A0ABR1BBL8_POLSC
MESGKNPLCIFLFSGKRKTGKDFITEKLLECLDNKMKDSIALIKISGPIKSHFAETSNLNLSELMGSGEYKEKFRKEMIEWSEELRLKDPGMFCRAALDMYKAQTKPVWIVSDVRRNTDVKWFKENFKEAVKTVRIEASDDVRKSRGWTFTSGIDDVASECDLDNYKDWDWIFTNNGDENILNSSIKVLLEFISHLSE